MHNLSLNYDRLYMLAYVPRQIHGGFMYFERLRHSFASSALPRQMAVRIKLLEGGRERDHPKPTLLCCGGHDQIIPQQLMIVDWMLSTCVYVCTCACTCTSHTLYMFTLNSTSL